MSSCICVDTGCVGHVMLGQSTLGHTGGGVGDGHTTDEQVVVEHSIGVGNRGSGQLKVTYCVAVLVVVSGRHSLVVGGAERRVGVGHTHSILGVMYCVTLLVVVSGRHLLVLDGPERRVGVGHTHSVVEQIAIEGSCGKTDDDEHTTVLVLFVVIGWIHETPATLTCDSKVFPAS